MIKNKKLNQFSFGLMNVQGITIHNTGNELSAKENYDLMKNSVTSHATHFFVDENEVIQAMPLSINAWHTGKGYDRGNMSTISIEICRSTCTDSQYQLSEQRAIKLIKKLLKSFKLDNNSIYFHNDFDKRNYCPHRILDIYKTKNNFIERRFLC